MNSLSGVLDLLHMSQNIGTDCKNTGRLDYKIFWPMKDIFLEISEKKSSLKHFLAKCQFHTRFFSRKFREKSHAQAKMFYN